MISAREALALPKAALSDSDRQAVEAILADLDAHVRANMTRVGCEPLQIDARRLNNIIAGEVGNRLRQEGWLFLLNEVQTRSQFTSELVVSGYSVSLRPTDEVYDDLAREAHANGTTLPPLFAGA